VKSKMLPAIVVMVWTIQIILGKRISYAAHKWGFLRTEILVEEGGPVVLLRRR